MKKATYIYNPELEIKASYDRAIARKADKVDYAILSENFVGAQKPLLSFNANYTIKFSSNIEYDKETFTYYAKENGYVDYGEDSIELFPFYHINADKTICSVVVPLKSKTNELLTIPLLKNEIYLREIKLPVADETIQTVLNAYNTSQGGTFDICRGRLPINGRPAIVHLEYDITTAIGSEDETGKIDYKTKNFINNVTKGELIATWTPPVESASGRSIYAEEVLPKVEKVDTFLIGTGLLLNEETGEIVAETNGILHISPNKTISVTEDEVISGNVDLNVGNLEVQGNLIIEKSVLPGFIVKATGNITIKGSIEEATVEAGEHLFVAGGCVGNAETRVRAKGNINVAYLQNANLFCEGDLEVQSYIMNSKVLCNGKVKVTDDKRGRIVGGETSGRKGIDVTYAGNKTGGIRTTLICGVDAEQQTALLNAKNKAKELDANIKRLQQALGRNYFEDPKKFLSALPKPKLLQVKKVLEMLKEALGQKKTVSAQLEELELLAQENRGSSIAILKEGSDGLVIQIMHNTKVLEKPVPSPTRFVYDLEVRDIIPVSVKRGE